MKVSDIKIVAVVRDIKECSDAPDTANKVCKAAIDGEYRYQEEFGNVHTSMMVANLKNQGVIAVKGKVNSILFIDWSEKKLITKLEGRMVSADNVFQVLSSLEGVELTDAGEYRTTKEGLIILPITKKGGAIPGLKSGIFGGSGFGFGLFGIPFWLIGAAAGGVYARNKYKERKRRERIGRANDEPPVIIFCIPRSQ